MLLPKNTPPGIRRITWVMVALVISFGLLSCSLLSRGPGKTKTQATNTGQTVGSESTLAPADVPVMPKIALPRSFRYAGLEFDLQQAGITKQPPEGANTSDQRGAYAQTIWKISNPGTDAVRLDNGVFTLQLGGAAVTKAYDEYFNSQETKDLNLVFSVPANATWDNASISFAEQGKVPASLPLEGEALKELYPQKLAASGQAELKLPAILYQVQSASVDLDGIGQRADAGSKYLLVQVNATCKEKYDCFVAAVSFRVIADGTPYSPKTILPVAEAVHQDSTVPFRLAFQVPDGAKQVDLQVGEADKETAKIPLNLTPGQ